MLSSTELTTERIDNPMTISGGQGMVHCAVESFGSHRVVSPLGQSIPADDLEQLEQLDDTVFAALDGDAEALDSVARRWRAAVRSLDKELIKQSREQYLRKAKSVWRRSTSKPALRLSNGFAALELLELFSDKAA